MSKSYQTPAEAKKALLDQSKRWRAELEILRKGANEKTEKSAKALTGTIDRALDEVVQAVQFQNDFTGSLAQRVEAVVEGTDLNNKLVTTAVDDATKALDTSQAALQAAQKVSKQLEELNRKANAALSASQAADLKHSQQVLICRNIPVVTNRVPERFEDMEKAFLTALKPINFVPRINHVKRLQRIKTDDGRKPASLKVELSSVGEKLKLFMALDRAFAAKVPVSFSVMTEIPQYAMSQYRFMGRLASLIRERHPSLRTKVCIVRGGSWPVVTIKEDKNKRFELCPEELLVEAKKEHERRAQIDNDRKRASTSQSQPMQTGPGITGN